jgi:glycosyltransferase involved in cell wall biosynthesis
MSTILIISPEPWDGHFVSKHHYARELARRGHRVVFHGPPETTGAMHMAPVADAPGDLRVLHAPRVAPGLRFLPAPLRRALEARWLGQLERMIGARVDVVWNFENSRFFDMGFAGERLKIYQQVDLNQHFHPDLAARTADLAIAISGPIEQRLAPAAHHLIRITHGHAPAPASLPLPDGVPEDFALAPVNVVLTGNLDMVYLDVELIADMVRSHPAVRFHFIGSYRAGQGLHGATGKTANVRFWGRQPAALLPAFLARADLLLVAYLAEQHLAQLANPHKVMEYLAAGRCILATRTLEYENRPDLLEMAQNRADFARRFGMIVANPTAYNRPEQVTQRLDFARDNTYPRQIDRILQALGPRGHLIS